MRITATEMISARSASTTSVAATIAATAANCSTPLSDLSETGTIAIALAGVCCAGFVTVCGVVLAGCFFLWVLCA